MLVISRKTGEEIQIGDTIKITIVNIDKGVVRLGIKAPEEIHIQRIQVPSTSDYSDKPPDLLTNP
jgi:carbon storage regulator